VVTVSTTTGIDPAAVRRAVEDVPDPELPPVTLGMLGMLHEVGIERGTVTVELLPTFSGCPATEMMERDVTEAVRDLDGVEAVSVRFRYDPPWTAERITHEGREALREFGIAPPGGDVHGVPQAEGRMALPLALGRPTVRPCPYCGSTETVQDSAFGPTPCRDLRWCEACSQPFEAFKDL
jgi:ring-1,2-phenylacetyl-CoA epoxidase subunit PaaD